MHIVAGISIWLLSHFVLGKCNSPETRESYAVGDNLPSRQYLPSSVNPLQKSKLERGSDIETVVENDLDVIPLAADHDRRNGFQYQPIISHQYSTGSTESPRYSNFAVPNWNTRVLGSPINNENEVKPITKSHLSRGTVAYGYRSTPGGNNPSQYPSPPPCFTQRFQTRYGISPKDQTPANYPPIRKILTVNDQEDNTHRGSLTLQLTPPRSSGIRIDNVSTVPNISIKFLAAGPRSKGRPIDQDIKPVSESIDDDANGDDYKNEDDRKARGYQLGTLNSVLKPLLQKEGRNRQGYDRGFNTPQHPPPDPILALILSHYGRYLPGLGTPRPYGYMAVNNIHNNKPFGGYKLTRDYDGY